MSKLLKLLLYLVPFIKGLILQGLSGCFTFTKYARLENVHTCPVWRGKASGQSCKMHDRDTPRRDDQAESRSLRILTGRNSNPHLGSRSCLAASSSRNPPPAACSKVIVASARCFGNGSCPTASRLEILALTEACEVVRKMVEKEEEYERPLDRIAKQPKATMTEAMRRAVPYASHSIATE